MAELGKQGVALYIFDQLEISPLSIEARIFLKIAILKSYKPLKLMQIY